MVAKKKKKKKKETIKSCSICGEEMEDGHVCCGELESVEQKL
jgi:hypothetical protein